MPSTLDLFEAFHLHQLREQMEAGIERTETMTNDNYNEVSGSTARPDDVFAAADEQHRPPDWMADQAGLEQARLEVEEARMALAQKQEKARQDVQNKKELLKAALAGTSLTWVFVCAEGLVKAMEGLERVEERV